jgi:hypothetical protein
MRHRLMPVTLKLSPYTTANAERGSARYRRKAWTHEYTRGVFAIQRIHLLRCFSGSTTVFTESQNVGSSAFLIT